MYKSIRFLIVTIAIALSGQSFGQTLFLDAVTQTPPPRNWVDTQATYTDSHGNTVSVTNSLPKGGGTYTDATGKTYSYVIFWYQLKNESDVPMELAIDFQAEPLAIFPSPESYARIMLPPDTMTAEKIQAFDYGITDLKGFLDAEFANPGRLSRTIQPKEEFLFYISLLFYQAWDPTRTAFVLDERDLFFSLRMVPAVDAILIPCGQLVFKE